MISNDADFESQVSLELESTATIEEPPFHILLLGDWSGNDNKPDLSQRHPMVIDRDNFDDVMSKLHIRLDLDLHNDGSLLLPLSFTELEDFHPDRIFEQVSIFANLRDIRRRLLKSDSFNEAAREVSSWLKADDNEKIIEEEMAENTSDAISNIDSVNLLDQILSKPIENSASESRITYNSELNELLGKLVKPYLVEIDETEQSKLLAAVDEATSELMRLILHNKQFQSLEADWRALYFLVRKVETDVDLKIYLLDVSKFEVLDNLKSVNSLVDSHLYKWIIRDTIETSGGEPWAVVGGSYSFGLDVDDIAALIRLGKIASSANAPFVSHVRPKDSSDLNSEYWNISDESSEGKLWTTLRSLPESSYLGFAVPRFLARLPYGNETEPLESFSFEEFSEIPNHDNYLWANPCFACVLLIAQTYRLNGWEMNQLRQDIEGLPSHIYRKDGETVIKPATEIALTVNTAEKIIEQGLMALISFKNSEQVQLTRFQSIAYPLTALQGRWNF
jgi:type VI secretion system protein ImpC